ncbi:MAG: cytochrome c oxidase accessory protein CcoG [Chitinophagales bacterium]|nr:cytochrome c oxidase accessory protein CcoG [Chitinophagales bacterium]
MAYLQTATVEIDHESFRDHLTILDEQGRRKWIYPRFQDGPWYRRRAVLAYVLLAALVAAPLIRIHGQPLFLFNILERTFIVWGIPFFPQDFFLFAFAMITFMVFVIFFTSVWGRWWCGWACPQTVFMEFVFRKLEYAIEGSAQQQRRLDAQPWNSYKIWRKTVKHVLFLLISVFISSIFLSYIIGSDAVMQAWSHPADSAPLLLALVAFSLVFYGVFAWLREQVCIGVCPYGRLQGVLLDRNSRAVMYDFKRGEPRGKAGTTTGDCVDCHLCVAVCPTGIDIRNGTQLECINCTACMDGCDSIMAKLGRAPGLIRHATLEQIETGRPFRITPRMVAYGILWTAMIGLLAFLLVVRPEVKTSLLRARGQLYQQLEDGTISNLYNLRLINKTFRNQMVELEVVAPREARLQVIGAPLRLEPGQTTEGALLVFLPAGSIRHNHTPLHLAVRANGKIVDQVRTSFMAPMPPTSTLTLPRQTSP